MMQQKYQKQSMSTINKLREALVDYLTKEIGIQHIREFSESLRILDICDLKDDDDLKKVTSNGLIDTLVVLFKFGTLTKLVQIKKEMEK